MNVEVVELPEMRLGMVSHRGPYQDIPNAFATLGQVAGAAGLIDPSASMIAVYHDDPRTTAAEELRSDAAITISRDTKLPSGLTEGKIPAGRYARTTHVGPYDELMAVWPAFMKKGIPDNGYQMRQGPSFELYRNTPGEVPAEKLITELYVAVD